MALNHFHNLRQRRLSRGANLRLVEIEKNLALQTDLDFGLALFDVRASRLKINNLGFQRAASASCAFIFGLQLFGTAAEVFDRIFKIERFINQIERGRFEFLRAENRRKAEKD